MRNIFKSIVGALAIAGAAITAVPAQARHDGYRDYREHRWSYERHRYRDYDRPRYRHYRDFDRYRHYYPRRHYHRYYRDDDTGAILAAGIIGLAIGAAIASERDRRYDREYRYEDYYD